MEVGTTIMADPPRRVVALAAFSVLTVVRTLIGFQPHSGQDNYHGLHAAYGGDFEAQRHWMELTLHVPISHWYWYELDYWGLDYPPLTAYISYLSGYVSQFVVGPESVALTTSRGYEDPTHKAYMRGTVIATDLLFYGSAVWFCTRHDKNMYRFFFATLQPAILLIDHGHFQYNTSALGLALWAFYFITQDGMKNLIIGSIFFCLALSFKQMTLYYAPAVFFYLLGRCFGDNATRTVMLQRFLSLGGTVIATLTLVWSPVVFYGPPGTTYFDRLAQVLHRILPFYRGLYEGKVSNIWCILSLKPFRIRQRIPESLQPWAALVLTVLLMTPSCYALFRAGHQKASVAGRHRRPLLLWGTTSCALAFFLGSFQVHEKSLLIALAPATLLYQEDAVWTMWFSIVSAWTLWPLMVVDRLEIAYICVILMFVAILDMVQSFQIVRPSTVGFFQQHVWLHYVPPATYSAFVMLHVAELVVTPPHQFPDLFPVLWSAVGCGCCGLAWVATVWHLLMVGTTHHSEKTKLE